MKHVLLKSFLGMCGLLAAIPLSAQTYGQLWEEADEAARKDLPQTALQTMAEIYRKADKERNFPQQVKAWMAWMSARHAVAPDSVYADVLRMEQIVAREKDAVHRSVWQMALGNVYRKLSHWSVRDAHPTPAGNRPEDLREWTWQMRTDRALECHREALADVELLGRVSTEAYAALVDPGEESRYFRHDLLSLMAREAVKACNYAPTEDEHRFVADLYGRLQAYYTAQSDVEAAWLVELDRATFVYEKGCDGKATGRGNRARYLEALDTLLEKAGQRNIGALVYEKRLTAIAEPAGQIQCCREAMQRFPAYKRLAFFQERIDELTAPQLVLRIGKTVAPGEPFRLLAETRNLEALEWEIREEGSGRTWRKGTYVPRHRVPAYRFVNDTIDLPAFRKPGRYVLTCIYGNKREKTVLNVTSLEVVSLTFPDGSQRVSVLDRLSGHPVSGARVHFLERGGDYSRPQYKTLLTTVSNGRGFAYWKGSRKENMRVYATKDGCGQTDTLVVDRYYREGEFASADEAGVIHTNLYTDRGIYRPGQTVQVSGLVYLQSIKADGAARVLPHRKHTLSLRDANNRELATLEVETNDFGSFSGRFTLPASCLPGYFSISSPQRATAVFRVEEYKRPTFEVAMQPVEQAFALGDSLQVGGQARTFAGAPLQGAKVTYTVSRTDYWWSGDFDDGDILATGELYTDQQGNFRVPVRLEPGADKPMERPSWCLCYRVKAEVVGLSGETQSAYRMLRLSNRPLNIDIYTGTAVWNKQGTDSVQVMVCNLDRRPIDVQGTYWLRPLAKNERGEWQPQADSIAGGTFRSGHTFRPAVLNHRPSGKYRLYFRAADGHGRETVATRDLVLFSWDDKQIPVDELGWSCTDIHDLGTGKGSRLMIGSAAEDACLIYDVFCGNKLLESKQIVLNRSTVTFEYADRPEYAEGLLIHWMLLKQGQLYENRVYIPRKMPERRLALKWETFRDRLKPGQQEEWRLRISLPDGRPAQAELLATMYDASLNRFAAQDWTLFLPYSSRMPVVGLSSVHQWQRMEYFRWNLFRSHRTIPGWEYDCWKRDMRMGYYDPYEHEQIFSMVESRTLTGSVLQNSAALKFAAPKTRMETTVVEDAAVADELSGQEAPHPSALRKDFSETAFFYPHVRTDSAGVATLAFTLPESLTTWNFLGLAHTQDMFCGNIEAQVVAQKDFMLQANLPRFVRAGDKALLSAALSNRSQLRVDGTVRMELFDPLTEKVIASSTKPFVLEAGKSTGLSFGIEVDGRYSLLACRMVAESERFSDGEQRYLPVLTNKEWVTEARTITLTQPGRYELPLDELFNGQSRTATNRRLTLEFTNNPAWLAIMALPSVATPKQDDALSLASAYYALRLGGWIVEQQPRIKAVLDTWKVQGGTSETLWSQLQQNAELKNIVLEETPWVGDAANEAEQRSRLATLFDLNSRQSQAAMYLSQLEALQLLDGSWSWFKGMKGSPYITVGITEMLARLNRMTGGRFENELAPSLDKGMDYLGTRCWKEYQAAMRAKEEGHPQAYPSEETLHYMYVRTLYNKVSSSDKEASKGLDSAVGYFFGLLTDLPDRLTIHGKAVAVLVAHDYKNVEVRNRFMKSLAEYTVQTPEMGAYFDTGIARYSGADYRIPTQVAVIEACHAVGVPDTVVAAYQQWLLKQKQAQAWDRPHNSVNAVYALLLGHETALDEQPAAVLALDGKRMGEGQVTTALGYIKETVNVADGRRAPRKLVVQQAAERVSWGSVYAQYLEDLEQVRADKDELGITRRLLVRRWVNGQAVWQELKPGGTLQVGDRVLSRLVVQVPRDMDFVQIVDKPAACFEAGSVLSGYRWDNGVGYYRAVKDASVQYFADRLGKGTHLFDMEYTVNHAGTYRQGTATVQSAYAPELTAHTGAGQLTVE